MKPDQPASIEALVGVVAAEVLLDAVRTSRLLARLGVPHALVGGLAVGLHGHPRATRDVDFLVDESAFASTVPLLVYRDELAVVVRMGVVDLLAVPQGRPTLQAQLEVPAAGEIPVIDPAALVLMKLDAGRGQDREDVVAMLDAGIDQDEVGRYLADHAPDLVDAFAELLDRRDRRD